MKKNSMGGITLVSMVITIIVMLILAGVSINMVVGENGVLTRAQKAALANRISSVAEDLQLAITTVETNYQSDWAEATTFSAFKGVYVTEEKLNKELSQAHILNGSNVTNYLTSNFSKTQKDIVTTTSAPKLSTLSEKVYTDEHPVCYLADLTTLKTANQADNIPFVMYLSNGVSANEIGKDFYVAVCKFNKGIPMLVDFGIVESDVNSAACVNGKLLADSSVGYKSATSGTVKGVLPTAVKWWKHADGLKDTDMKNN